MKFNEARREAMSRAARARVREGQRPGETDDRKPILVATLEHDGATWELYDLKPKKPNGAHIDNGGEWSAYKLVALPGRSGKANYWFGYNWTEMRMTKSKEVLMMLESEPAVYAWVLATIDEDAYGGMA